MSECIVDQGPDLGDLDEQPSVSRPDDRLLQHQSGTSVYVWWALGKRRNRAGARWKCWFAYIEYRRADGRSAYRQLELALDKARDATIWQQLSQLALDGLCVEQTQRWLSAR
ncbi:hypothetical protein DV711_06845 [Motiliproteus coralliicola]|uniref:Uncharacterized protein n=1 Tax=Motiliproteus coralliicola TaxID=2283196 RepID=A0A369WUB8_9GAMM|nr:hypothetical protein [Motiliproteus coralliicola]RDE25262.1 hypothetical protein DV711_06845 [Motiliproteus coralliicola]